MNLPDKLPFCLKLANLDWPVVCLKNNDGSTEPIRVLCLDAPGTKPIVGLRNGHVERWNANGRWDHTASPEDTILDLFLSADPSDPAVRKAVEAAHKAGEPVSYRWADHCGGSDQEWYHNEPLWLWGNIIYLPTRLLPAPPWTMPEPPSGEQWHKPEALTEQDWRDGWRPLLIGERSGKDCEIKWSDAEGWEQDCTCTTTFSEQIPHRTRRPLPAKPEPVYWSKPEHVPLGCWVKCNEEISSMVVRISKYGITASGNQIPWHELKDFQHSTDRVNWKPCTIQPEQTA